MGVVVNRHGCDAAITSGRRDSAGERDRDKRFGAGDNAAVPQLVQELERAGGKDGVVR
jgi:hypothetical protein